MTKLCPHCAQPIPTRDRFLLRPIRLRYEPRPATWLNFGYVELGQEGPHTRVYRWYVRLWRLVITFGPSPRRYRPRVRYVPDCGWLPAAEAERVEGEYGG